jgi:KDO2-lipid IV(A) lauroyltransferase
MSEPSRRFNRIAFIAAETPEAEAAKARLIHLYGSATPEEADVIVALGGDGLMLQTLHTFRDRGRPIYGMHRGSVGFLMNTYREDRLMERLSAAEHVVIHPLIMEAVDQAGMRHKAPAINEVALLRQTYQASMRAALEHGMLWWGSDARLRRLIRVDNPEAALGDGVRPVIWLAPHFVGLDMGGVRLTMDRQIASIYAPAKDPVTDRFMLRGRSRFFPITLISRGEGIKPALKALKHQLPFYYLPDQDYGRRNAEFVPFFGVPAATVTALPRLAKLTGAQIVPVVTRQLPWGRGYALRFYPPWDDYPSDDVAADVARMNAFIEERIREMPPQYLWLHRRFKTRPAGEPSLYE